MKLISGKPGTIEVIGSMTITVEEKEQENFQHQNFWLATSGNYITHFLSHLSAVLMSNKL